MHKMKRKVDSESICFMKTKISLIILCVVISSCALTEKPKEDFANEKKYAVAYCLANSYPDSAFTDDAKHVSGAYLYLGDFGLGTYEQIRDYVSKHREKAYVSKHGRNLNIMQCIDLYESEGLDQLIRIFSHERSG